MYAWIWRHLPGPLPARVLVSAVAGLAVLAVLLLVVFPALDAVLPSGGVEVGAE